MSDWTPREIALLTELRAAGDTNPVIAARLGRSVLSVASKARALHLESHYHPPPPPQPPPRHGRRHTGRSTPRAGKTTLPPLASLHD